jgi:hypothetical protein
VKIPYEGVRNPGKFALRFSGSAVVAMRAGSAAPLYQAMEGAEKQ